MKAAIGVAVLLVSVAIATVAGTTRASAAPAGTLTIATTFYPPGHDPSGYTDVVGLSYDTLIYKDASGKFVPQLATSWRYVGKSRRTFVLTLRKGVRFSDGSPMTAEVVKDSLLRSKTTLSSWARLANFDSVTVLGPQTVKLHLAGPNPLLPKLLAQYYLIGVPICRALLSDPEKLKTVTCGTGPYMLDTANTIPGDHYTLKPNPYYWNKQAALHYRSIVVRVIANPTSIIQAMRTGQVDVGSGEASTLSVARSAGLRVYTAPSTFTGIHLQDVQGTLVKPLGDIRVRQALNYAIDRETLTKGVFPTPGLFSPLHQPFTPLHDTYIRDPAYAKRYPYNPARARQLLAAAGYPNGFELEVVSTPLADLDTVTQAIGSYWEKIGVRLKIKSDVQAQEYRNDQISGRYPAYAIAWSGAPAMIDWYALWSPNASSLRWATFKASDAQLNSLARQALRSPEAAAAKLWQQFGKRLIDLAWFVPVTQKSAIVYTRPTIAMPKLTPAPPPMSLRDIRPASN